MPENPRRSLLVLAALWAGVWAALSPLLLVAVLAWAPATRTATAPGTLLGAVAWSAGALLLGAVTLALKGAVSGAAFAALLRRMERGRRAEELTTGRLVFWANVIGAGWTASMVGLAVLAHPGAALRPEHLLVNAGGHALLVSVCAFITAWLLRRGGALPPGDAPRLASSGAASALPAPATGVGARPGQRAAVPGA